MLNMIAILLCSIGAIIQGLKGNIGLCLIEMSLVVLNLPFTIQWIRTL